MIKKILKNWKLKNQFSIQPMHVIEHYDKKLKIKIKTIFKQMLK